MKLKIAEAGTLDYLFCWQAMKKWINQSRPDSVDEIWLLEHPKVFTHGVASKPEHLIKPSNIPVIQTDRGGQITYHGPGQLVFYTLINIKRLNIGTKTFVSHLEQTLIHVLEYFHVKAHRKSQAPGIYVGNKKIASIGLRVSQGYTYHGLALNIDMDLKPFSYIHPCGFKDLDMCQLADFKPGIQMQQVKHQLIREFSRQLGYTTLEPISPKEAIA